MVSSSYADHPLRPDEEMRQTNEDGEDLLTPRDPPDAEPDWDGVDGVISGIPIPRSRNVNIVRRAENYRTSLRGPIKVDERSALLPRLSEEAPALIVSGRQSDCIPKSVPDVVIGQSTFSQTVSPSLCVPLADLTLITAIQCHCSFDWYWHAFGTTCVLICRLDLRYLDHRLLWLRHLLYVCYMINHLRFLVSNRLPRAKFLATVVVSEPSVRSYVDIGQHAFGTRSMPFVNFLFCFETFSVG